MTGSGSPRGNRRVLAVKIYSHSFTSRATPRGCGRIFLSSPALRDCRSVELRALCNEVPRTPPGPEGSNGTGIASCAPDHPKFLALLHHAELFNLPGTIPRLTSVALRFFFAVLGVLAPVGPHMELLGESSIQNQLPSFPEAERHSGNGAGEWCKSILRSPWSPGGRFNSGRPDYNGIEYHPRRAM